MPLFGPQRSAIETRLPRQSVVAVASSCTGSAGATVIAATHGDPLLAVLIFGATQTWIALELACRWRLRWRHSKLQEDIARAALGHPENENLRTLMMDVASTHQDELGRRLPTRPRLGQSTKGSGRLPPDSGAG